MFLGWVVQKHMFALNKTIRSSDSVSHTSVGKPKSSNCSNDEICHCNCHTKACSKHPTWNEAVMIGRHSLQQMRGKVWSNILKHMNQTICDCTRNEDCIVCGLFSVWDNQRDNGTSNQHPNAAETCSRECSEDVQTSFPTQFWTLPADELKPTRKHDFRTINKENSKKLVAQLTGTPRSEVYDVSWAGGSWPSWWSEHWVK